MARPSNEELLEERRAIAELVKPNEGESNLDALRRLLESQVPLRQLADANEEIARLQNQVIAPRNGLAPGSGTNAAPPVSMQPNGAPPMDPALGDLTPDYARHLLATVGLVEVRVHYAGREHYLPDDIQAALKGGK